MNTGQRTNKTRTGLPTFDEFLRQDLGSNSYVKEPGFRFIYVRKTRHLVGSCIRETIDLANMEAKIPGRGAFKRLVARLRRQYPSRVLYVENVLNPLFVPGLLRLGFVLQPGSAPPSFYLPTGE